MDAITKALVDQRKEEIRQWQNTYREATAEAVDTAQRAIENIKGLRKEIEMIQMLNV